MRIFSKLMVGGNVLSAILNLISANVTGDRRYLIMVLINIALAGVIASVSVPYWTRKP